MNETEDICSPGGGGGKLLRFGYGHYEEGLFFGKWVKASYFKQKQEAFLELSKV